MCHKSRSVNEVICHGIPDKRKLKEGDIINIGTSSIFYSVPNRCTDDVSSHRYRCIRVLRRCGNLGQQ